MTDDEALAIMIALGDRGRFEIFRKVCDRGGQTAGDLASGKAASTTSHHLAKLEKAGVLQASRNGKTKCYSVDAANLHALAALVSGYADHTSAG